MLHYDFNTFASFASVEDRVSMARVDSLEYLLWTIN